MPSTLWQEVRHTVNPEMRVHEMHLTFAFFVNDYNLQRLHMLKLINDMALLLLSHQTAKVLPAADSEYWADS